MKVWEGRWYAIKSENKLLVEKTRKNRRTKRETIKKGDTTK